MDFAEWAGRLSQATNASLAGASVWVPEGAAMPGGRAELALRMAAWGLRPATSREAATFVFPELPQGEPADAAGRIARAEAGMPVTRALARELAASGELRDVRVGAALIVEPKTAVLLMRLAEAGAQVGVYCHAHECDQAVADELARRGFLVEGDASWTPAQERAGALALLDRLRPQVLIDDGANVARLLVQERPSLVAGLLGVCEETTSGIRAFRAMGEAGELPFPVVDVNDSALKTAFDNRHGTGETCVTTCQRLLGWDAFDGARVAVVGFGPVGEGFARRARALGARVAVVDTDPRAALRAAFAGFDVRTLPEALAACDLAVSATGVRHTLRADDLRLLPDGAAVAVIGGIANEVDLDELAAAGVVPQRAGVPGVSALSLPGGPTLRLLAAGDGVNYAVGPGNPIEVMDLSFAVQLSAVAHLLAHACGLPNAVVPLPAEADRRVAALALAARGLAATDDRTPEVPDWRRTRFADTADTVSAGGPAGAASACAPPPAVADPGEAKRPDASPASGTGAGAANDDQGRSRP